MKVDSICSHVEHAYRNVCHVVHLKVTYERIEVHFFPSYFQDFDKIH